MPCSHFFCEKCINSWVIKAGTCPLCRVKLQYNKKNEIVTPTGIKGTGKWDVIDNDEKTNQEIKKDSIEILLKLTNELFNKS